MRFGKMPRSCICFPLKANPGWLFGWLSLAGFWLGFGWLLGLAGFWLASGWVLAGGSWLARSLPGGIESIWETPSKQKGAAELASKLDSSALAPAIAPLAAARPAILLYYGGRGGHAKVFWRCRSTPKLAKRGSWFFLENLIKHQNAHPESVTGSGGTPVS